MEIGAPWYGRDPSFWTRDIQVDFVILWNSNFNSNSKSLLEELQFHFDLLFPEVKH